MFSEGKESSGCFGVCYEAGPVPVYWGEVVDEQHDYVELRDEFGRLIQWPRRRFIKRQSSKEAQETFKKAIKSREALSFAERELEANDFYSVMNLVERKFGKDIRNALEALFIARHVR